MVLIENQYLQVRVQPGPAIELHVTDQRTGGSIRFALSVTGCEVPPCSMEVDEEGLRGVWLGFFHNASSAHVLLALSDSAEILVEVRSFNRVLEHELAACAISLGNWSRAQTSREGVILLSEGGAGLHVVWDRQWPTVCTGPQPAVVCGAGAEPFLYGPRQTVTWSFRIIPFTGLEGGTSASGAAVASWNGSELRVLPTRHLGSGRVVVATEAGTMEAAADLTPRLHSFDLASLKGVRGIALVGPEHQQWLLLEPGKEAQFPPPIPAADHQAKPPLLAEAMDTLRQGQDPRPALLRASLDPASKSAAYLGIASFLASIGQYSQAVSWVDDAILFNGEDPLAWWAKAALIRNAGEMSEETPELPNAHFIAPLEPALRAESFLRSDQVVALLDPLAERPHEGMAAVLSYLDLCLWADSARLLDALLSVKELRSWRLALAYCYLHADGATIDAAEQVRLAEAAPVDGVSVPAYVERALARFAEGHGG
jgi:hypothetical protein